jgi:hypothetical protein
LEYLFLHFLLKIQIGTLWMVAWLISLMPEWVTQSPLGVRIFTLMPVFLLFCIILCRRFF